MNIKETAELFRAYIDEPDATFVTDSDIKVFLAQGYREFRDIVTRIQPETYSTGAALTMTDAAKFDFATTNVTFDDLAVGKVLGASATAGRRLVKLISVSILDSSTSLPTTIYEPVTSSTALERSWCGYMLVGTKLVFSGKINDTINIAYVPEQSATMWDNLASTDVVDDLSLYHDVVALLASKQYAIRDGAFNQPLMEQLGRRLADLEEGLTKRVVDAPQYVQRVLEANEY
tara:strand:+ start:10901 stop:11596 length:696 start_codon:yes stop_codon:yes gene_type:complete